MHLVNFNLILSILLHLVKNLQQKVLRKESFEEILGPDSLLVVLIIALFPEHVFNGTLLVFKFNFQDDVKNGLSRVVLIDNIILIVILVNLNNCLDIRDQALQHSSAKSIKFPILLLDVIFNRYFWIEQNLQEKDQDTLFKEQWNDIFT